jgi:predicted amidohydrolase YtcJ
MMACNPSSEFICHSLPEKLIQYGKGRLTVASIKLYMDGALGSWGAALLDPYTDNQQKNGLLRIPPSEISGYIESVKLFFYIVPVDFLFLVLSIQAMNQSYQVNVHCIGDAANRIVLDAFESIYKLKNISSGHALRNRIEHSQIISFKDVKKFGKLGIIPSVQPTHGKHFDGPLISYKLNVDYFNLATSDMPYAERRLGKERIKGAYLWKTLLDSDGVKHLALGSDFPVEDVNPMLGVYSAVTRKFLNGSSVCSDVQFDYKSPISYS